MNKNTHSFGNQTNVSHSVFDSAIPFIQFVYESEGIAGVAELYRSVVGNQTTNRPVNSILVSIRILSHLDPRYLKCTHLSLYLSTQPRSLQWIVVASLIEIHVIFPYVPHHIPQSIEIQQLNIYRIVLIPQTKFVHSVELRNPSVGLILPSWVSISFRLRPLQGKRSVRC